METTSTKPNKLSRAQKIKAAAAAVIALSGISYAFPAVHSAVDTAVANASGDVQTPDIINQPHRVVDATPGDDTVSEISERAAGPNGNPQTFALEITKALGGDTTINVGDEVPVPEDSLIGKPVGPLNG
jgi:hypothetical protein